MKHVKIFILSVIMTHILTSCETIVNIEIPETKRALVVNSFFSPEEQFSITVSHSLSILDNSDYKQIPDAVVHLYEDGADKGVFVYDNLKSSYSLAGFKPAEGKTYKITASAAGYDEVNASDVIPASVPFTLSIKKEAIVETYQKFDEISIQFSDPAGAKNFYSIKVFTSQKSFPDTTTYYPVNYKTNDPSLEPGVDGMILNDKLIDGKSKTVKIAVPSTGVYYPSTPFIVALECLSETAYLYNRSYAEYMSSHGDPFSEPAQVYNNIKNGFGIFAAFSAQKDSIK